jgi:signal transduction histidine kinase/DNA-binding response OmpR family regulator
MFFGGRNGLISFYPEQINENKTIPAIIFTDLKLFNKTIGVNDDTEILAKQLSKTKSLTLAHDQNFITVDFAVLNYIKSAKNRYAYKMVGIDRDWNYVDHPTAVFTNLNPGSYTLMIKGSNNDGYWNTSKMELHIYVKPAPWKTWWAYSIYLSIIFISIFMLVRGQRMKSKLETELKLEQLSLQREEEVHQLKMKFFTNISHEIRTPLTLLITPLEKLIGEYRKDPYLYKNLIGIKNHTDRLLRLVNQLLDFRRQEVGEIKIRVAEGNFIKFIKEIKLSFEQRADQSQIQYVISHDVEDLPLWFDRDQLEKVFYNLLSNAFKFTPPGLSIRIVIEDSAVEGTGKKYLVVRVENEGKGIPPEDLENIFNRFYSTDFAHVKSPGMGIGLSLAKSLIEAHDGKISVTSEPIDGNKWLTVFKVSLPKGRDHFRDDQIIKDFQNSEHLDNYTGQSIFDPQIIYDHVRIEDNKDRKYSILLAEDNANIRAYIMGELQNEYKILEAENGKVAFDIAAKEIPDVIISDVMMPELDGVRLCSKLKNDVRTSHIPVILLTARTSLIYTVEGLESGADDYLTKPFNLNVLQLKIHNFINARNSMRSKFSKEFTLQPENLIITSPDREFLTKLKSIVEENIANPDFKIPDFSSEIGMSRPVIYRKVKALTGMTLIEFLNDYRLNKAAQILLQHTLNIAQTSSAVGFSDPNYFSKSFKKKFGVLPTHYINENT